MSTATPDRRGAASATFQCAGDIGMGVGSLVGGVGCRTTRIPCIFAVLLVLPVIRNSDEHLNTRSEGKKNRSRVHKKEVHLGNRVHFDDIDA